MTVVTGELVCDVTGRPDNTVWWFTSPVTVREGSENHIVTRTRKRQAIPTDGRLRIELEPGPTVVEFDGETWLVTVPDTDIELWPLIETSVSIPPETPQDRITAAVNAWLEANVTPGGPGGGPGPASTDQLPEGTNNKYFTDARADARIAAANLVPKSAVDDDATLAANSATKIATQRATRLFVLTKIAELIGAAPPELDTWIELVAAIQADQSAISAIMTALSTKATPADISSAISALVGGATGDGNTLKKLEDRIVALATMLGGTPPVKMDAETHTWPSRPAVSFPVFWVGGDAPVDRPAGMLGSDVWFPATGDDIDLGVVLEALQGITAAANTVPYFDAINHAANLAFKIAFSSTPSDTALVSEKAIKNYVDKMPTATKAGNYDIVATDVGWMIQYNSTVAGTFTVTNAFAAGHVISYRQIGTGVLTIASGAGTTKDGRSGYRTAGQFAEGSIHFDTDTHFYVTGDMIV